MSKKRDKLLMIVLTIPLVFLVLIGVTYAAVYVPPSDEVDDADFNYNETSSYYYFPATTAQATLVMYTGGFVDVMSYGYLAQALQNESIDVYLLKIPLNFALLGIQAPERIRSTLEEDMPFYVMGHSLGGVAAAEYVHSKGDVIDGLIMLASYPAQDLSDVAIDYLSIVGSLDTVLNQAAYDEAKPYWPSDAQELVIEGGNHAQFGHYGEQQGDTPATIDTVTQQTATVDAIVDFIFTN